MCSIHKRFLDRYGRLGQAPACVGLSPSSVQPSAMWLPGHSPLTSRLPDVRTGPTRWPNVANLLSCESRSYPQPKPCLAPRHERLALPCSVPAAENDPSHASHETASCGSSE